MFLFLVLSTFLTLIVRPRQISLVCPESMDLGHSFGLSFWVQGLVLGSRIEDEMLTPEAPVLPHFQVVFLSWMGVGILGIQGLCGTMDQGFSRAWIFQAESLSKPWQERCVVQPLRLTSHQTFQFYQQVQNKFFLC